jgi:hypothetical protein
LTPFFTHYGRRTNFLRLPEKAISYQLYDFGAIRSAGSIIITVHVLVFGAMTMETLQSVIPLLMKRKSGRTEYVSD